jgi:hypothetical protein
MRRARKFIVLFALALLLTGLWFAYTATQMAIASERDYLWTRAMFQLVEGYVAERGEWPKSWHDLEQVKVEGWRWPEDSQTIQGRIVIDFGTNIDELASQSVDQFRAIRPIDPNAFFNDENVRRSPVESLLKAIRRQKAAKDTP